MKVEDAMNLLATAAVEFKGNLKDHQLLQEAIKVVKEALAPKEAPITEDAD